MKLSAVLSGTGLARISINEDPEISGLTEDSRTIQKGDLFFARKGIKTSGLSFVQEAVKKGAAAIISEENLTEISVPVIKTPSVASAEIELSENFYHSPSKKLKVVGVTGTNGKTTFTYLLESVAFQAGKKAGVIGTINYRLPNDRLTSTETYPAPNTTPNVLEIQKLLYLMVQRKCDWVLMEVSSHALALKRVDPLQFYGAVFTNLTQDHLDFHKNMEDYFLAKSKLFSMTNPDGFSVINSDDPYGKRMTKCSNAPVTTYGIEQASDITCNQLHLEPLESRFHISILGKKSLARLKLPGRHNIYNGLAAAATAFRLGISLDKIVAGLERLPSVPGRLEPISCGQNFSVYVDYAHTEDALYNVLNALKPISKKRVLTLFGCGGDRDKSKRPKMGITAVQNSDFVIVTSDNPRTEDPEKIIQDIEDGIKETGKKNYQKLSDREEAIKTILKSAEKDDIVLLAGKGHETYQIFKDQTIHFDDREVARTFLLGK